MEDTLEAGAPVRRAAPRDLLTEAAGYAEDRHWEVVPGTRLVHDGGGFRCSCADPRCPAPGAHPAAPDWADRASAGPATVRRWWTAEPDACILLPTGRAFDVVDVPETAGCLALARMERMRVRLGPVVAAPVPAAGPARAGDGRTGAAPAAARRLRFLVLPGTGPRLPELLRRVGCAPERLDLTVRGEGDYLVAPPSRIGSFGSAQWARPPTAHNRRLPQVSEVIGPLAHACGRCTAAAAGPA